MTPPWVAMALRRVLHGSDRKRAVADENAAAERFFEKSRSLERRLREEFSAAEKSGILVGRAVDHGWDVVVEENLLAAAIAIIGPSGSGKSYLTASLANGLFAAGVRRMTLLDPKNETADLMPPVIVTAARKLSSRDREALFDRVALIDLFGVHTLPPLNVCAAVPGLDPETQAHQIASILEHQFDDLGVRQAGLVFRATECLVRAGGLPLTVLPHVFEAPQLLLKLSETAGHPELFRTTARRLEKESKERVLGIQARLERLFRLRVTRLAFTAHEMLDFERVLGDLVALVRLAPGADAPDVAKMLQAILWAGIANTIRRRPNGASRTHLIVEEMPAFLSAIGREGADGFEDLARLARSKRVHMAILSQDWVSLSKISPSLVEVLRGNVHVFFAFRSVVEAGWDFILPITGRRRKQASAPWETEAAGFLDRGAELALLRQELSRLPDRHCYFVDRRSGLPGVKLRTADLVLDASKDEVSALEARARRHPILKSVSELELRYDDVMRQVHELLGATASRATDSDARASARRAQGKLDIG